MNIKKIFVIVFIFSFLSIYSNDKELDNLFKALRIARIEPIKMLNFNFKDMDGNDLSLSSLKGKVVFLNFWATWCPPCIKEMPSMQKLYDKFKNKDFVMIALSSEDKNTVKQFLNKNKYTFHIVSDELNLFIEYNISSIPTTFIINGDGYIIGGIIGSTDWSKKEAVDFFDKIIELNKR